MSSSKNLEQKNTSFLTKSNSAFIEQMYLKYINKDKDLSVEWKKYFDDLKEDTSVAIKELEGPSWGKKSKFKSQQLENIILHRKEKNLDTSENTKIKDFKGVKGKTKGRAVR